MKLPDNKKEVVIRVGSDYFSAFFTNGIFYSAVREHVTYSFRIDDISGWCYADAAFKAWSLQWVRNGEMGPIEPISKSE